MHNIFISINISAVILGKRVPVLCVCDAELQAEFIYFFNYFNSLIILTQQTNHHTVYVKFCLF